MTSDNQPFKPDGLQAQLSVYISSIEYNNTPVPQLAVVLSWTVTGGTWLPFNLVIVHGGVVAAGIVGEETGLI